MQSRSAVSLLLLLMACGAESSDGSQLTPDAAVVVDSSSAANATVSGKVRRSAAPSATGDARGRIFVAIFDRDPVIDRDTAQVVGRTMIDNADLSPPNAVVDYSVVDVPTRTAKYYFVAFLDDNANVDPMNPSAAGPDKGDLVSLDGLASPTITLATPGAMTFDVTLNTVLPF